MSLSAEAQRGAPAPPLAKEQSPRDLPPKMVICVRSDLGMNRGKIASQAAHAAMLFILDSLRRGRAFSPAEREWMFGESSSVAKIPNWGYGGMTKIVVAVSSLDALRAVMLRARSVGVTAHDVTDKTLGVPTCCAVGPAPGGIVDALTGSLPMQRD